MSDPTPATDPTTDATTNPSAPVRRLSRAEARRWEQREQTRLATAVAAELRNMSGTDWRVLDADTLPPDANTGADRDIRAGRYVRLVTPSDLALHVQLYGGTPGAPADSPASGATVVITDAYPGWARSYMDASKASVRVVVSAARGAVLLAEDIMFEAIPRAVDALGAAKQARDHDAAHQRAMEAALGRLTDACGVLGAHRQPNGRGLWLETPSRDFPIGGIDADVRPQIYPNDAPGDATLTLTRIPLELAEAVIRLVVATLPTDRLVSRCVCGFPHELPASTLTPGSVTGTRCPGCSRLVTISVDASGRRTLTAEFPRDDNVTFRD